MIFEIIGTICKNIKRFFCPFIRRIDDEWCCKRQKAVFGGYYECDGYCPKKGSDAE